MTAIGILLFAGSLLFLLVRFARGNRKASFPAHGWLGLGIWLLLPPCLAWPAAWPVRVFLTPIAWTAYILAVDGAVFAIRARSPIVSDRWAFGWMAVLSVPLWLIFEVYNLRLQNWTYTGLPSAVPLRLFGYLWSFATIWPAVLETAELLLCTSGATANSQPAELRRGAVWVGVGVACLALPWILPLRIAPYLFGFVWLGFVFLLEPLNRRAGRATLTAPRVRALLISGLICGFIWEFWNYWAAARWLYVFPILQDFKIFEMPLPGYLGFPVFALEVFVMYVYATAKLRVPYHEVS
jgi:hypothetical protein